MLNPTGEAGPVPEHSKQGENPFEELPAEVTTVILGCLPLQSQSQVFLVQSGWSELKEDILFPAASFFGFRGDLSGSSAFLQSLFSEVKDLCQKDMIPKHLIVYRDKGKTKINYEETFVNCQKLSVLEIFQLFNNNDFYGKVRRDKKLVQQAAFPKFIQYLLSHVRHKDDLESKEALVGAEALAKCTLAGCKDGVELLLNCGVNPNEIGAINSNPTLFIAIRKGYEEIAYLLISRGANPFISKSNRSTALHQAARCGSAKMVAFLLSQGLDKDAQTNAGMTPLHLAAIRGDVQIMRILLDAGANHSLEGFLEDLGDEQMTPLHYAALEGKTKAVKLLVEKGANLEAQNGEGMTPIDFACTSGDAEMVRFLFEEGAVINDLNNLLWLAKVNGHKEVARYLSSIIDQHPPI